MTIHILLADDHTILRAGLKMMLNAQPDMEVVGEAQGGRHAIMEAQRLHPDIRRAENAPAYRRMGNILSRLVHVHVHPFRRASNIRHVFAARYSFSRATLLYPSTPCPPCPPFPLR